MSESVDNDAVHANRKRPADQLVSCCFTFAKLVEPIVHSLTPEVRLLTVHSRFKVRLLIQGLIPADFDHKSPLLHQQNTKVCWSLRFLIETIEKYSLVQSILIRKTNRLYQIKRRKWSLSTLRDCLLANSRNPLGDFCANYYAGKNFFIIVLRRWMMNCSIIKFVLLYTDVFI